MEGNLSGERFPSFGFLYLCCGIRLIGKAEWWEPLPRGRSGNVVKRRGGSQRSIRMAPSSFSYERRLGALAPIELGNRIPLLRKKKRSFPDGPFSAMLQAVPLAASRSKESGSRSRALPLPARSLPDGLSSRSSRVGISFPARRSYLVEHRESALAGGREEPPGEAPLQACFGSGVRLPPSLLERPMNTV